MMEKEMALFYAESIEIMVLDMGIAYKLALEIVRKDIAKTKH